MAPVRGFQVCSFKDTTFGTPKQGFYSVFWGNLLHLFNLQAPNCCFSLSHRPETRGLTKTSVKFDTFDEIRKIPTF